MRTTGGTRTKVERIERLIGGPGEEEAGDLAFLLMAADELRGVDEEAAYLAIAQQEVPADGELVRSIQLEVLASLAGGFGKREGSA